MEATNYGISRAVSSGGSTTGSTTTVSNEDNIELLCSEVSSSSSSSSSSAGTMRTADVSVSPPNGNVTSVVGWLSLSVYRMNRFSNQAKSSTTEEISSTVEENKSNNVVVDNSNEGSSKKNNVSKEKGRLKTSLLVKVNMDGIPIRRNVDLNAISSYKTLARTLNDMFCATTISARRSSRKKNDVTTEEMGPKKLSDGLYEFVLTYEDKEGDWMLVGDVPWRIFRSSVQRLRIMRTSEANGLAPRFQERNG